MGSSHALSGRSRLEIPRHAPVRDSEARLRSKLAHRCPGQLGCRTPQARTFHRHHRLASARVRRAKAPKVVASDSSPPCRAYQAAVIHGGSHPETGRRWLQHCRWQQVRRQLIPPVSVGTNSAAFVIPSAASRKAQPGESEQQAHARMGDTGAASSNGTCRYAHFCRRRRA